MSPTIFRSEDARELLLEERLSPLDLEVYPRAIEKAKLIENELDRQMVIDALKEGAGMDSKGFHDAVRCLNEMVPEKPILMISDYVGDIREAAEPDWVIYGIAVRNNTTLLYGDAGVGKTTFYLHLADGLMNGSDFVGIQCTRCKPLIICQDEDHSLLKNHWSTMGKAGLLPVAKRDIVWDKKDFNKDFELTLTAYKPDVVFIDSYTSLGIPNITTPESGSVFDATNRMARKHQCAVILIHHTNQSGEQMGNSLHRAKVSSMVSILKSDDNHIVLTQEKVRGSHFEPIVIRFDRDNLTMEREEGSLREQVWRLLDENEPAGDIIQRFPNRNRATILRYVREYTRTRTDTDTN
ncbi:AAA family ATPase [Chloroflexota bacterium]